MSGAAPRSSSSTRGKCRRRCGSSGRGPGTAMPRSGDSSGRACARRCATASPGGSSRTNRVSAARRFVAAAAQTKNPVRQALVSSTGTFWDTVVVCAMTGLVLVNSGEWINGLHGAALTKAAFTDIPVVGPAILDLRAPHLRLLDAPRLVVLRREGERVSLRNARRQTVPVALGGLRHARFGRHDPHGVVVRRYHERAHGDPESRLAHRAFGSDREGDAHVSLGTETSRERGTDGAGHSRSEPSRRAPMGSFAGLARRSRSELSRRASNEFVAGVPTPSSTCSGWRRRGPRPMLSPETRLAGDADGVPAWRAAQRCERARAGCNQRQDPRIGAQAT